SFYIAEPSSTVQLKQTRRSKTMTCVRVWSQPNSDSAADDPAHPSPCCPRRIDFPEIARRVAPIAGRTSPSRLGGCMLNSACYTYGRSDMSRIQVMAAAAFAALFAVSTAWGQQQTQRVAGTIDKVEGNTLYIKSASGPVTLKLADNALVVARVKASAADIKAGDYVASGGVPQPDGTPKAVELRIFPDRMRRHRDRHR